LGEEGDGGKERTLRPGTTTKTNITHKKSLSSTF